MDKVVLRPKGRLRRRVWAAGLAVAVILGSAAGVSSASAHAERGLLVSKQADRSNAVRVSGAVLRGNAYIFVKRSNVASVAFYLDDQKRAAAPVAVERVVPFDLAQTRADGSANALDTTKLSNGTHTIVAVVSTTNNRERVLRAKFMVSNKAAVPNPTLTTVAPPTTDVTTTTTLPTTTNPSTTTKPTTTSTTTRTPTTGACIGAKHTPGGPDGMGGCWPGPQNTGYPKGLPGDSRKAVALTNYSGPFEIRSCGVVIDSKIVDGDLLIQAGNGTHSPNTPCVTIKNSLVKGTIHTDNTNEGPVVISDTEVAVPGETWWASIGFYNTFTWRVNSHGGQGTIKCADYCASYDSWVHGMHLDREYHYNAFGGNGMEAANGYFLIEHAYADCGGFTSRSPNAGSDAGCSADIGFYGDFAPIRNITINKTFFAPARMTGQARDTQPGYCLNSGYYPGKPYPNPSNIVVTNNVFAKGENGKCGVFGGNNTWLSGNGNVWSNNKWDDGTVMSAG